MISDQVGTVRSWEAGRGTGLLARDDGREDLEISRDLLVDGADLTVGQRVAFREAYEPTPNDEWGWTIHDVRVVSDEEAAVLTLERVCRDVAYAEERMRTAQEVASDDDVESAREDIVRAKNTRGSRINEIGRELVERGGSEAIGRVLDELDQEHRSTVAREWAASGWS